MASPMAEATVRSFFVTLKRSYAGTPWFHQRILRALGLKRRHLCVEKPNNISIRGMLHKVPHMVIVETDKMYFLRRMKEYHQQLCRSPLLLEHALPTPSPTAIPPQFTNFTRRQLDEHVLPREMDGFNALFQPQPPRRYFVEQAQMRKVKVLTEHGLFSQKSKAIHERELTHTEFAPRRGKRDT